MGFFDLSFSSYFPKCTGKEVMGCKGIFLFLLDIRGIMRFCRGYNEVLLT